MKKTPGLQNQRHGLQSLGKIGSAKSLSAPVPLPSLKRSSDVKNTSRKGSGGDTLWSSVVKNGKETNTSSNKLSNTLDSGRSHRNANDRPLENGEEIQTWSAVVTSGLKPATKQSQVPNGKCKPNSDINSKENKLDESKRSLETIPDNASVLEHIIYSRQKAPLDSFPSNKRSSESGSSERSQVQRDGYKDKTVSYIEDKGLSTKIAKDAETYGCHGAENSLSTKQDLPVENSNEDILKAEKGIGVEDTIAVEFVPEINLRPQSGFMAAFKQRESVKAPASVIHGSDEDRTLLCQPCDREGSTAPAFGYCTDCCEHLCQPCFRHHQKATPSRHHVLLDKDEMPCSQSHQVTKALIDQDEFETWCCRHEQKELEFFCETHRHLACNVCVILDHRNCDHVRYIPDIARNYIDSSEYLETINRMETVMTQTDNIRTKTKENVMLSNESLSSVIPDMKELREKINNRLDEMETAIRIKSEELREGNEKKLKKTEVTCNFIDRSVLGILNKVKQLKASNKTDKLFIALVISDYVLKDHEANIFKLQSDADIDEYKFVTYQNLLLLLEDPQVFGFISPKRAPKE